MRVIENQISASRFEKQAFERALTAAAGVEEAPVTDQVAYLARYAEWLGARTVVREEHYIDRHFIDEHALYYSRNLRQPSNAVRRFHLFSKDINDEELARLFEQRARLAGRAAEDMERELSSSYLGFTSIRPVFAAPVGRTILKRLEDGEPRDMLAVSTHEVHLANIRLSVDGLAFQQQDLAVGACATAAVWSALSAVARREGMRAPTPAEVSQAASRHILPYGRTLPAMAGLNVQQLCEAVRAFGFAPEVVRADVRPELFLLGVHTYLLSGIPVVLVLNGDAGTHAVTAVGFQLAEDAVAEQSTSVPARSARVWKLYIHDDGLGPYARSFLFPTQQTKTTNTALLLGIEAERIDRNAPPPEVEDLEMWLIDSAIVPVYPKLRLPAASLISLADLSADLMEKMVGEDLAGKLEVELYYERSGKYLGRLGGQVGAGAADFMRRVALPRWCGVVRWLLEDMPIAEFIYDTTDILRDVSVFGARELIRAIVCFDQKYRPDLLTVATAYETLCL